MNHADLAYKAHAAAKALSARARKDDDCGCGCDGAGSCRDTWRRLRHIGRILPNNEAAMLGPIKGRQDLIDTKAALHSRWTGGRPIEHGLFIVPAEMSQKVGAIRSNSRLGQAAQGLATMLIPGDSSIIRSPVRSTVYSAITPGGGGRRGRLASIGSTSRSARRCPPGFEHGGRFANRSFSNCGRQLFDLAEEAVEKLVGSPDKKKRQSEQGAPSSAVRSRAVAAGEYGGSSLAIQRAARIPKYSKSDPSKFSEAVDSATATAGSSEGKFMRMIRRDGVSLTPVSAIKNLARQRNNPDMTGSALVISANKPEMLGGEELSLLGAGISEIHMVVPGGGKLIVKAKKGFTPKKAGSFRRSVEAGNRRADNPGKGLYDGVELHKELSLSAQFDNIDNPNDMVVIERGNVRRTVQRWAFHTWYAEGAPGRPKTQKPWTEVQGASED